MADITSRSPVLSPESPCEASVLYTELQPGTANGAELTVSSSLSGSVTALQQPCVLSSRWVLGCAMFHVPSHWPLTTGLPGGFCYRHRADEETEVLGPQFPSSGATGGNWSPGTMSSPRADGLVLGGSWLHLKTTVPPNNCFNGIFTFCLF